jgi:hydroxyacylglutathione hydrolase
VEPDNVALQAYTEACQRLRAQGLPTLPSTIGTERQINPFLRCQETEVSQAATRRGCVSGDPVDVFATLRTWKNEFK